VQSTRTILEGIAPFRSLSAEARDALARAAELAEVESGQMVYDGTSQEAYLYVVLTGAIRLEHAQGARGPVRRAGPSEAFGWHAMHGEPPPPERATAESASTLLRVHGRLVLEALAREPNGGKTASEALVAELHGLHCSPTSPPPQAGAGSLPEGRRRTLAYVMAHARARASETLRSPAMYLRLLGYALVLGFWYVTVDLLALPRFSKLPGLAQVVHEWLSPDPVFGLSIHTPVYYEHIWASIRRIGIAFALATSLGVPVGLLLGASTRFREYVFPVFELLRPIPILAWVPLAIIMFSGTETPVIFLTFLASFFATALNTLLGVRSVDPQLVLAARCLGASRWQTFRHVVVPGSLPSILTGLQISIGVAWFSLAAAEMVSGQLGLGYLINTSYTMVQYPTIVIGMLTLGAVGYATSAAVRFAGARLTAWRARELAIGGT
jgi:NitT/TauT family transport system permease protein